MIGRRHDCGLDRGQWHWITVRRVHTTLSNTALVSFADTSLACSSSYSLRRCLITFCMRSKRLRRTFAAQPAKYFSCHIPPQHTLVLAHLATRDSYQKSGNAFQPSKLLDAMLANHGKAGGVSQICLSRTPSISCLSDETNKR